MIDLTEVLRKKHQAVYEVDGATTTGEEKANHGLSVRDRPQESAIMLGQTIQQTIQSAQPVVAQIGCFLRDKEVVVGWKRPGETNWRVRLKTTRPNNPTLRSRGDAKAATPPLSTPNASVSIRVKATEVGE